VKNKKKNSATITERKKKEFDVTMTLGKQEGWTRSDELNLALLLGVVQFFKR